MLHNKSYDSDRIIKQDFYNTNSPYGPRPLQITALGPVVDEAGNETSPAQIIINNEYDPNPNPVEEYEIKPLLTSLISLSIELGWLPPDSALHSPAQANELKTQMKARLKFKQIIRLHLENEAPVDQFQLGQILGAQQTCAWLAFDFMEPIKTALGEDYPMTSQPLFKLATNGDATGLAVSVSGQWLIDNQLVELWAELRDIPPAKITLDFKDTISYNQAKIIGLVGEVL